MDYKTIVGLIHDAERRKSYSLELLRRIERDVFNAADIELIKLFKAVKTAFQKLTTEEFKLEDVKIDDGQCEQIVSTTFIKMFMEAEEKMFEDSKNIAVSIFFLINFLELLFP